MSLTKWKAWPVENLEDVLKIDKKAVSTKRGSCAQFLAKNFFLNHAKLNKYSKYLS